MALQTTFKPYKKSKSRTLEILLREKVLILGQISTLRLTWIELSYPRFGYGSRMSNLAKLAYRDSELWERSAVQIQQVSNSFIQEVVARAYSTTFSEALSSARESEKLYERLRGCPEIKEKHTNRFLGRAVWRQERVDPHTLVRAPKSEDYREKLSGESRGCYSCK